MVLCKFYQQGYCFLGTNCRNDHVDIKEIIKADVEGVIYGKQWPLSTYGPFRNKPSMPNFIEDQSFEEVRMMFYEAKLKNLFGQLHQQFNNDVLEARNKTKTLLQMTPDMLDVAINLYNATSDTSSSCLTVANTNNIINNPFASDDSGLGKSNAAYNIFEKNSTLTGTSWGASAILGNSPGIAFQPQQQQQALIVNREQPESYTAKDCQLSDNCSNRNFSPQERTLGNRAAITTTIVDKDSKAVNIFGGKVNANKQECENQKNMNKNEISQRLDNLFLTNTKWTDDQRGTITTTIVDKDSKAVNIFGGEVNANKQECKNQKNMNKNEISQRLDNLFLTNTKCTDDHVISKRIDKSIMDLILVDMLPYSVVEGVAFQRIQFADPIAQNRYRKKNEQFFRTSLMPETFNKVKGKVVAMLEAAKWISLTIDNWSYPKNSSSLLSFTAHFLVGSSRKKLVLWATVLENDHEDSYISDKLSEIITNYKLEEKIHLVVCDNVQNMEAAKKFRKLTPLKCVAHTMQQVIHDAILNKKDIQAVISKCRSIVYHLKTSKLASKYFETIPESLAIKKQYLVLDDDSKWSSTYLMMESLIEQRLNVNLYTISNVGIFRPNQWDLLKEIVETFECFYEAMIDLSAATVSLVIPLIYMLVSKMNENDGAEPMKNELKHALKEKFKFIETCPFLIVATFLDPRFKNKYLNETQIQIAEKEISEFLGEIENGTNSVEANIEIEKYLITKSGRKIKNTLWKKHDSMASFIETDISFRKELLLYSREPLKLRKSNIYEYWNSSPYKNLKKVAVKYLSAPPSIDADELGTDKRTKLKGLNSEELFCHFNIQYLDFDY